MRMGMTRKHNNTSNMNIQAPFEHFIFEADSIFVGFCWGFVLLEVLFEVLLLWDRFKNHSPLRIEWVKCRCLIGIQNNKQTDRTDWLHEHTHSTALFLYYMEVSIGTAFWFCVCVQLDYIHHSLVASLVLYYLQSRVMLCFYLNVSSIGVQVHNITKIKQHRR